MFFCFKILRTFRRQYSHRLQSNNNRKKEITGEATGYLARVIQHEIDHHVKLCLEDVKEIEKINREEYISVRKKLQAFVKQELAQSQFPQARQSNLA